MRVSGVTVGSWGGGGGYSPWLEEGNWSTNEGIYITSFPWYPFTFSSDIISGPMPHTTKYSKIRLHIFPVTWLTRNSAARLCCFLWNLVWEGWKWRSVAWLERERWKGWCLRERERRFDTTWVYGVRTENGCEPRTTAIGPLTKSKPVLNLGSVLQPVMRFFLFSFWVLSEYVS